MTRLLWMALAGVAVASASATAAPAPQRVRGTIEAVNGNTLTVKDRAGQDKQITLDANTRYASVVSSSLSTLKPGDFIGTATKGPSNFMVALEVVIFPNSMRGTGEGQYPWDGLPDTTMPGGGATTASTMTNGNVTAAGPPAGQPQVQTTMTNGSVTTDAGSANGKEITVQYDGKSSKIMVPPTASIVRFVPGDRTIATTGSKVFVVAHDNGGKLDAGFVAVGKNGVTPPM